jgi:NADH-quinone oxidoreductase subunit G
LFTEFPHFAKIGQVVAGNWTKFAVNGEVKHHPFHSPIDNFYMTNSISRSSKTMADCTKAFVHSNQPAEAAE